MLKDSRYILVYTTLQDMQCDKEGPVRSHKQSARWSRRGMLPGYRLSSSKYHDIRSNIVSSRAYATIMHYPEEVVKDFHLNVYANKSHCANGIIGMIDTPSLIIYYCDSRRPLLITNSLISQISQNPLYPWCDSGLHSECLVGRMSVSGLFGCLSSEVDSFTPFP